MINMDQRLMQEKGISATDVLNAVNAQNLVVPTGTVKIGPREYDVRTNAAARSLAEISEIPIKQIGATTLFVRDVAVVSDGFAVQTNIVRQDGRRSVLVAVLKNGRASTLDVVAGVRAMLPRISAIVPPELKMTLLSDQSVFVRGAIGSVVARGGHRRRAHRPHDPALPRQLAQHGDHRHVHSSFHPQLGHHPQPAPRDDQYHDPRRPRPGRRHPGG